MTDYTVSRDNGPNGCVIALAVVGGVAIVAAILLCVFGYIGYTAYTTQHAKQQAQIKKNREKYAASASSAAASRDAAPHLTALPPAIMVTSADKHVVRDEALDFSAEFDPKAPVTSGRYQLASIEMSGVGTFAEYEHDPVRSEATPLAVVFADTTSKQVKDKSGAHYTKFVTVTADRYVLTRDKISFQGHDDHVGDVTFDGAIDPAFLLRMNDPNHTPGYEQGAVMTGTLTVAGQTIKNATFSFTVFDSEDD